MVDVQGTVTDGFEPVRDAFAANFAQRGDTGAAVCVHRNGRTVVDLWGGSKDAGQAGQAEHAGRTARAGAWTADTVVTVRSVTKGVAAAVPHLLHQRGQLDLDAPVAAYWPEFKAAGKERVLVRHLLAHRAGLPVIERPLTMAEAADGVSGPHAVAAQAPVWEPGTAHGYHAHTYGWLLGELVLRATGRTLGRWFAEEVAAPLGLDLWIGLPASEVPRVARLVRAEPSHASAARGLRVRPKRAVSDAYRDPESLTRRAFGAISDYPKPEASGRAPADEQRAGRRPDEHWAAELPASGGIGTARALSACYAALIGDLHLPHGTRRLFTPATLTQARSQESAGPDQVLVVNTRFGLGYMLHGPASPMLGPGSFGHPGRGGSLAFADPEAGLAFAYVTNGMRQSVTSDPRARALVGALRGCLGRT